MTAGMGCVEVGQWVGGWHGVGHGHGDDSWLSGTETGSCRAGQGAAILGCGTRGVGRKLQGPCVGHQGGGER